MGKELSVHVDKAINIPIHEQIYMQLKSLILIGDIDEGMRLPGVRQMSDMIKANRHTITKAYNRLEAEGFVETYASSGTFVKTLPNGIQINKTEQLSSLINNLFQQAAELGFDKTDVMSVAYASLIKGDLSKRHGLFIECNAHALESYVADIRHETNIIVEGCLLDDLENMIVNGHNFDDYDVIMTTMGHYADVKKVLHSDNIYALNFGPYLSVVKEIRQLEPGTNFGIICVTERGTWGLRDVLVDLGISSSRLTSCSIDNEQLIDQVIERSDVLIVSKYARLADPARFKNVDKKIIEYKNVLQRSSVQMLEQVLQMHAHPRRKRINLNDNPSARNRATS